MRQLAAVAGAKITGVLTRSLRLGGGTALPGLVAQRLDPQIVAHISRRLGKGSVLITGTNGKTTTARLLRGILRKAGLRPVANRAGSNMMRGIAAALTESAGVTGNFRSPKRRIGVFEVDEAILPQAAAALRPRVIAFTNLFRDQLDRYGEVERVARIWRQAVALLPSATTLVLNADDPSLASLASAASGPVVYYGLNDSSFGLDQPEHAADARWCSRCGLELVYDAQFYGHIGHWRCGGCNSLRPSPQVACASLLNKPESMHLSLQTPRGELTVEVPLLGLYNAYNVLAAVATGLVLDTDECAIQKGLESITAAFGRQERLEVDGRQVQVILAKNPAGLNQVLRTITSDGQCKDIVLFLNDKIADGRDVSWIWDVDFELLRDGPRSLTVSGTRAWDLALRLKYAGLERATVVETDTASALRRGLRQARDGETLYVVPTYTAMLEVRELLARWAGSRPFWREK